MNRCLAAWERMLSSCISAKDTPIGIKLGISTEQAENYRLNENVLLVTVPTLYAKNQTTGANSQSRDVPKSAVTLIFYGASTHLCIETLPLES